MIKSMPRNYTSEYYQGLRNNVIVSPTLADCLRRLQYLHEDYQAIIDRSNAVVRMYNGPESVEIGDKAPQHQEG